jgi:hypothetical protein
MITKNSLKPVYPLTRTGQNIASNIVIIDGFSGSGKSLVAPIFGYLDKTEHWQMSNEYDDLSTLHFLGELSTQSASALLKLQADRHLYDLMIGRNVNFRKTDQSSPYYYGLEEIYLSRIEKTEGDHVLSREENKELILPLHVHYIFGSTDILYKGFDKNLKLYLISIRDPFFLIDVWFNNSWPSILCEKQREFTMCCECDGGSVPWFATNYAKEYLSGNELEKSILTMFNYYSGVKKMYNSLSEIDLAKTLVIEFEEFAVRPEPYIDKISTILNTSRRDRFNDIMSKLSLPRETVDILGYDAFLNKHKNILSHKYLILLEKLENIYASLKSDTNASQ